MIERFLEQQPAICAALLSAEVRKSEKEIFTLGESDITCAEEVVRALKPMKDATLVMSEESMPTLSIIAPLHAKLVMGAQESVDDTPTDLPFLPEAETSETYPRLLDTVVAVIKKEKHQQKNKETDKQVEEENATDESHHPHIKDSFDSIPRPPLRRQRTSCALVDLLGATFASTSDNTAPKSEHDVAAAEIKRYRDETPLPLTGNPLSWRKDHEQEYPQLSKVARSFLCIPGTSVSAERVFSSAGDIVNSIQFNSILFI
ncbi:unnamed protein product [Oreochromis niloticus]|nr:unnamed protein product [Mustela putorius furo]